MKTIDRRLHKNFKALYWLLILAAICLYGLFSTNSQVWADEAYTFALMRHSFADIWRITAADVHPPLYYFLLKIFSAPFQYNLYVCRFLSALPCVLMIAICGYQFRKLFSERVALLFMLLYLVYPFTMGNVAEVRMYSLAEFLVTMNALWAYRCWKYNTVSDWTVFTLTGVSAAYTHYFALVSAGMVYGILLLLCVFKRRNLLKGWLVSSGATILLFLPWLGSFVSQLMYKVNNEYWIEPITLRTLISYVQSVFGANGMGFFPLYFGLAYATLFVVVLASRNKEHITLCLCALAVPLGTLAVGVLASILVRPVFVIRYLLPSIPLAVFFFSFALGQLSSQMLFSALITVALIGGSSSLIYSVYNVIKPNTTGLTAERVESLPAYDAFVAYSGNTLHVSQELSYRDPVTPIFVPDPLGQDNPYANRVSLDTFHVQEYDCLILILQDGEEIPEMFLTHYSSEQLDPVTVSDAVHTLWYLTSAQ